MASNLGKVSFSFSKINVKKPSLNVQTKEIVKKVDKIEYIDSIEDNSVNVINGEEIEVKKPLVIPLQHPNLLLQSVIDTVKSRKENVDKVDDSEINENECKDGSVLEKKPETLEEMAARELIEDATQPSKKETSQTLTVPLSTPINDNKESNLEDYENIPISDFGLAMLRGMGWDPKKGIGKNGKIVKVTGPTLRPKGLGLGADKAIAAQKPVGKNVSKEEVLTKGSKVRITMGQYKNLYGTVEGFNDDTGRIDVHMAISNEKISINECFVQHVTPDEFSKYSKVININAYNNYKDREESKDETSNSRSKSPDLTKSDRKQDNSKYSSSSKYKKHNKYDNSDSDKYKKINKYDDSDSDDNYRKHSKSTKHKKESKYRDSSSESDYHDKKQSKSRSYKSSSSKHSSKHSKRYPSKGGSSSDEKYRSKHRHKDSRKSRKNSSSSSDRDFKHRKSRKSR